MMVKTLSTIGNSLGIIIDRPILDLLDISKDTLLEITTDGDALIIRPKRKAPLMERALAIADQMLKVHDKAYQKLAE